MMCSYLHFLFCCCIPVEQYERDRQYDCDERDIVRDTRVYISARDSKIMDRRISELLADDSNIYSSDSEFISDTNTRRTPPHLLIPSRSTELSL